MLVDVAPAVIKGFLESGGMPPSLSQECQIQPVKEGGLAVTFKIETLTKGTFYLKLHEAEGARGGPFLKHLIPLNNPKEREHAEKRRHFIRKMLDSVIEQRASLIPKPCYFDLSPHPMAVQKLRGKREGVFAELRMDGEIYPPRLNGMVATLWQEIDIQHIPTISPEKRDVWNPLDYSPENVSLCAATIGEFQKKAQKFLEDRIRSKVQAGKGSVEEVQKKIYCKLQHEQKTLIGYDSLINDFFASLGIENSSADQRNGLQAFGLKILQRIRDRLLQKQVASITELQNRFLADVQVPVEHAKLPFKRVLFVAERERWWTPGQRMKGKAIDQLQEAETIAQELNKNPDRFLSLIEGVVKFKATYERLELLPQAVVHQDAHPFNFFINRTDEKIAMLDLEDLSVGIRFADVSGYVFKILRGVVQGKITSKEADKYLQAAIDGYNSMAIIPLSKHELTFMADYSMGVFLNFLPQFGIILRMNPEELDMYNLGMSLDTFMEQFQLLKHISHLRADRSI